jgi:hypothetical protein
MKPKMFLVLLFIIMTNIILAQNNMSFKLITFGANLFQDVNQPLYTSKIDSNGIFTFEPGINLSFEILGSPFSSVKFSQSFHADQTKKTSGFTQVMFRLKLNSNPKNSFYIGVGPIFFYRSDWSSLANYIYDDTYIGIDKMQYKFFFLSGELEYNYKIKNNLDFSISLNHLNFKSLSVFLGLKYWFKYKKSGCGCPSYK